MLFGNFIKYIISELLKVTRAVNSKLALIEWFFYNLVILIKLYKIRNLNLEKALMFPRKQVICLKNWNFWRAPTAIKFNTFCWNFAHVSYLTMSTKGCSRFFLCYLDLELFRSWVINECAETRSFWFLQITLALYKTIKLPNILL